MLAALLYFLGGVYQLHQGQPSIVSIIKVALIPLIFYLSSSQISSPGTDFPAYLLVWVTFLLWVETFESEKGHPNGRIRLEEIFVFLFSVTLVTIKLSMLTVVFLAGFIILKHLRRNSRGALKLVMLALILLAPWLTRNLILSGYWVYPVPVVASLSPAFDWKIPLSKVVEEARVIQAWARIPRADAASVLSMPLYDWSREWFENLTTNQMILVAGALLSPILYFLSVATGLRKKSCLGTYTFTFLVAYASVLFWLIEAPDIRFGYGLVVLAILLALAPLVHHLLSQVTFRKAIAYLMISMLMLYQGSVLYHSIDLDSFAARVLIPADYDSLSTSPCTIHNYSLFCAEWYNICGYDAFPCIPPSSADPQVELRGQSIRDGFRSIPGE